MATLMATSDRFRTIAATTGVGASPTKIAPAAVCEAARSPLAAIEDSDGQRRRKCCHARSAKNESGPARVVSRRRAVSGRAHKRAPRSSREMTGRIMPPIPVSG